MESASEFAEMLNISLRNYSWAYYLSRIFHLSLFDYFNIIADILWPRLQYLSISNVLQNKNNGMERLGWVTLFVLSEHMELQVVLQRC